MKLICQFLLSLTMLVVVSVEFSSARNKTDNQATRKTANKTSKKEGKPKMRFLNPDAMPKPFGYSHVAEAGKGRTIYISGQVAL